MIAEKALQADRLNPNKGISIQEMHFSPVLISPRLPTLFLKRHMPNIKVEKPHRMKVSYSASMQPLVNGDIPITFIANWIIT